MSTGTESGKRLEGRVAIVTGAAGGLGAVCSRRLVDEGAHVMVADLDGSAASALVKELGDRATAVEFDARSEDEVRELINGTVEQHGRLDLLHNNAVLSSAKYMMRDGAVADADADVWDMAYEVNLRGYMFGCKYAVPHMVANGSGVIVNMASDSALAGDVARTAYGCTKAAVITMSQYVATQYGKQGVRCVSVTPGAMMTESMTSHMGPEGVRMIERHHLTPRLGEPTDIAGLIAFLASDDAAFLTGINIPCDGGFFSHLPTTADLRG